MQGGGYTAAKRLRIDLEDGQRAFVKAAVDDLTAGWIRDELEVYQRVRAPFLPRLLAFEEETPALVLEDLGHGDWAPAWTGDAVEAVMEAFAAMRSTSLDLRPGEFWREHWAFRWRDVEREPEPFLSLGLCSADWLSSALPTLIEAAESVVFSGDSLIHLDVRSDNICLVEGRAVLVDWNWACVGNPDLDLACWLPSLHLEGGPPPERMLAGGGTYAALLAGVWGSTAGLPPPPTAPAVRPMQRAQLAVALPWAARELGLDSPS